MTVKVGDYIRFHVDSLDITSGQEYEVVNRHCVDGELAAVVVIDDVGEEQFFDYPSRRYSVVADYHVVVIVDEMPDSCREPITINNVKIEYIAVGSQFYGSRPTHVVNRSKTVKWFDYIRKSTPQAEWIDEEEIR